MKKPSINRKTLFPLREAQEAFLVHHGVQIKAFSTICRYASGIRVPYSHKRVRLKTVMGPGRSRQINLVLWNQFLRDLAEAYEEAYRIQDEQHG